MFKAFLNFLLANKYQICALDFTNNKKVKINVNVIETNVKIACLQESNHMINLLNEVFNF